MPEWLRRVPRIVLEIDERDVAHVAEVDGKLVELARAHGGKAITNDGNLGRLAGLSGVEVLNINELANVLKPVVVPGEATTAQVLREGKEPGLTRSREDAPAPTPAGHDA